MGNKSIKLVIFDLDGTLIDSTEEIKFIVNSVLENNNFQKRSKNFYTKNIGNGIKDLLLKSLPQNTDTDLERLLVQVKQLYSDNLNKKSRVFDGIYNVLDHLVENDIHIGIVTNKLHTLALRCVEEFFKNYDIVSFGAGYLFPRKPNPNSTLEIIKHYDIKPANTLFIGDSVIDINTAKNANIISGGVLWGNGTDQELRSANADLIFEHPNDLYTYLSDK